MHPRNKFGVTIVGDSGVGKQTLARQYSGNREYQSTISGEPIICPLELSDAFGKPIVLSIISCYRSDRFGRTQPRYRNCKLVIILYDVTNADSYDNVKRWKQEGERYAPDETKYLVVGTHTEDLEKRIVDYQDAKEHAEVLEASYYETSLADPKTGQFTRVICDIVNESYSLDDDPYPTAFNGLGLNPIKLNEVRPYKPHHFTDIPASPPKSVAPVLHHFLFGCRVVTRNIFRQVKEIHRYFKLPVASYRSNDIDFWVRNHYYQVLRERARQGCPALNFGDSNQTLTLFLRCNTDLITFKALFSPVSFIKSMSEVICTRLFDECCIGGSLDIITELYRHGYRWSSRGFYLAIAFGHMNIVKFIAEPSQRPSVNESLVKPTNMKSFTYGKGTRKTAKKIAKQYHRYEILSYLSTNLYSKLQALFHL